MNTKDVGDLTQIMVMAALIRSGRRVLTPFGDNSRYDLVIDDTGTFQRVQCKTGRLENGRIDFKTCSNTGRHCGNFGTKDYRGQVEFFGVYCPQNRRCYLVPVNAVGKTYGYLRVDPLRTETVLSEVIRWAKDYEIDPEMRV